MPAVPDATDDANGSNEPEIAPLMVASRAITSAVVRSLAGVSHAVTVSQVRVLVMLSSKGRVNLSSVADALDVNMSNASRTCDRLVRNGYVDRQVDPHDRRHVSLALTRSGHRLVHTVMEHRAQLLSDVVAEMPTASRETLMQGLEAFNEAALRVELLTDRLDGDISRWLS